MADQTVDSGTEKWWFEYANQIRGQLAGQASVVTNAIFIRPLNTQGIATAGKIDPRVTKNDIYYNADTLLNPDVPVYVPGGGSYCNRLYDYLDGVQLQGDLSGATAIQLVEAQDNVKRVKKQYRECYNEAEGDYVRMTKKEPPTEDVLLEWAKRGAQDLLDAKKLLNLALNAKEQIDNKVFGPGSGQLKTRKQNLLEALEKKSSNVPYNMECSDMDVGSRGAILDGGQKPPDSSIVYWPRYNLEPGLESWVMDCINRADDPNPKETVISWSTSGSQECDWSKLGYSDKKANIRAGVGCFLRSDASGEWHENSANNNLAQSGSSITTTIKFLDLKAFEIRPGSWDVPDARTTYGDKPNTSSPDTRNLVKPVSMLLGFGPKLEFKFDSNTYNKVSRELSTAEEKKANVSIFGFCIGSASASGSSSSGEATSYKSVNKNDASCTITIERKKDRFPVCLGVLARRV